MDTIKIHGGTHSTESCVGQVRWVPLSPMQSHRKKLQQLYEITDYDDAKVIGRRQEWRDVPEVIP